MGLHDLPTLADMANAPRSFAKGASRLEKKEAAKPLTVVDEKAFKAIVRKRDNLRCRMCGRKVIVQLARDQKRCEIHHLHGRIGVLRFEPNCAICVCAVCHEKLTGKVNERWIAIGMKFLWIDGLRRIDARCPIHFERVA